MIKVYVLCQVLLTGNWTCSYFGSAEICHLAATGSHPVVVNHTTCQEIEMAGSPHAPLTAPLPPTKPEAI